MILTSIIQCRGKQKNAPETIARHRGALFTVGKSLSVRKSKKAAPQLVRQSRGGSIFDWYYFEFFVNKNFMTGLYDIEKIQ